MFKILFFCMFCFNINAQDREVLLLSELLNTEKLKSTFFLNDDLLVINDRTEILFANKISFYKVEISYDEKFKSITPNKHNLGIDKNFLVLYKTENIKNKVSLFFWQPYSGAILIAVAKFGYKNKIKKIEYSKGAF